MSFNYAKLNGRMAERGISKEKLAELIGISRSSLYKKLISDREFTQKEIIKCATILQIQPIDIPAYFFTLNVLVTKHKNENQKESNNK
ncbi:DUF739 family protein [Allisonella histaminiformans]|uniref:DUF739 family protein n=1 Tax=Allisonella histaminiformans TaxID=209880 RepID=UPI0022DEE920|nr:DUF739 family protein [Allisonella histaminiformans]